MRRGNGWIPRPLLVSTVGMVFLSLAVVMGGCGGSGSTASDATTMTAVNILDNSGMHEIDAAIQQGSIPPTAQTAATHMQTVALLTPWPKELKSQAVKLAAYLGNLASVLNSDTPDMNKVKDASSYAHAGWHEFSIAAWSYLSDKAGVKN